MLGGVNYFLLFVRLEIKSFGMKTLQEQIIEKNLREYGERYARLKWVEERQARSAENARESLLNSIKDRILSGSNSSKYFTRDLSPGCRICGEGNWSCLFVNGKCNCRCFFCPSLQDETHTPMSNTVAFPRSDEYLDYIERFGIEGVGISGGEPLLTPETTLKFIREVRGHFPGNYLWMYTNGTLVNDRILGQLKDAGLDEIRFDIAATNYDLTGAKTAARHIPCVTVEIPAIPEDLDLVKQKILDMDSAGVRYLNLHQLRLTPFNFENLVNRNYTFLHGQKVTVLESEFAALELLKFAAQKDLALGVNYCSFVYKDRFQKSAARRRNAVLIKKAHEDITENGSLRSLHLAADPSEISKITLNLKRQGIDSDLWSETNHGLFFGRDLWPLMSKSKGQIMVSYFEVKLLDRLSYHHPFIKFRLNSGRDLYLEWIKTSDDLGIKAHLIPDFENSILRGQKHRTSPADGHAWRTILEHEVIPEGLQEYF